MCHLCGVCGVCCMSLNSPVSLCVAARCVSCVPAFSLVPFSIHVDASALCEAALSLKKLNLIVHNGGTHEALPGIFALQPLEELVLDVITCDTEVSSVRSPGMYVRTNVRHMTQ